VTFLASIGGGQSTQLLRVSSGRMSRAFLFERNPVMFSIGDDNSDIRRTPVVNYVLIALNVFVFVVFQGTGENPRFTYAFPLYPRKSGPESTSSPTIP
jgi:hypothetical protein